MSLLAGGVCVIVGLLLFGVGLTDLRAIRLKSLGLSSDGLILQPRSGEPLTVRWSDPNLQMVMVDPSIDPATSIGGTEALTNLWIGKRGFGQIPSEAAHAIEESAVAHRLAVSVVTGRWRVVIPAKITRISATGPIG
ncbi:MAG: hypothetical protein L3J97_01910 [Thermoplasmata archaeon]|nr:hypothetical protein [Thermoplasmata archaeon]